MEDTNAENVEAALSQADIYLCGHVHKAGARRISQGYIRSLKEIVAGSASGVWETLTYGARFNLIYGSYDGNVDINIRCYEYKDFGWYEDEHDTNKLLQQLKKNDRIVLERLCNSDEPSPVTLQDVYSKNKEVSKMQEVKNRPINDINTVTNSDIPAQSVVQIFNINDGNLIMGGHGNRIETVSNTFNFQECNINLQGNLNDLAGSLKRKGEIEEAEVLEDAVEALSKAEQCKTPDEIKKKGIANKLKRIVTDLGDENSILHKTIKGIKRSINIAQDIAKGYNDIAQWCGLPQVPKPFLKKE